MDGEHGAGTGLSGGHGVANASNTQHARQGYEPEGFNHGLGGEHASGGLPSKGQTPIADKFTSGGNTSGGLGAGSDQRNVPSGQGVTGEYAGSGANDALTGQSHAQRTGAGVGPLGENTGGILGSNVSREGGGHGILGEPAAAGSTGGIAALGAVAGAGSTTTDHHGHHHHHHHHEHGEHANLATAKSGVDTRGVDPSTTGTGVGPAGGAGGHVHSTNETREDSSRSREAGAGAAAGAGAGAGGKEAHFGTNENDFDRGAPVSDPKELDSGGRHGLVFNEATGKYDHRHDLEESDDRKEVKEGKAHGL